MRQLGRPDSINPSAPLLYAGRAYQSDGLHYFLCNKNGPVYERIYCTYMQAGSIHPNMPLFFLGKFRCSCIRLLIFLFLHLNPNFRHSLPPPSVGRHLLLPHLLMLAVSTLSRKSVSVTGKTCVNSRRVDVVALAGRR